MDHKFKVGDRVIFSDQKRSPNLFNKLGTVIRVLSDGLVDVNMGEYGRVAFYPERFKPYSPSQTNSAPADSNPAELKEKGQAAALRKAGSEWLVETLARLKEYCTEIYSLGFTGTITIDQFRARGVREPDSPNAWGALPRAAVKAGYISPTRDVVKALRPAAHARTVKVWLINPAAL